MHNTSTNSAGSSCHFGVQNNCLEEKPCLLVYGVVFLLRAKVEAQSWVRQQSSAVGHIHGEMGWRGTIG